MSTDDDPTGPAHAGLGVRLAVIQDIARAMRDFQPPDRISQAAVDSLPVHFPHLRSKYSTVAPDGQITVDHSVGPARELLTFSRKERISPTVFDLNEAVESSRALLGPLLGANIQLRVRLDRSLRCVLADRRQIEQVVANLALDARDAMPDGGSLTIETSGVAVTEVLARTHPDARCGSYARLSVRDAGTGMEPAILARLFEPFFATKEPGPGVGLGLSMVHGAVKQTVDSQPGRGTTFELYVPVYEGSTTGSEVVIESSVPS